MMISAMFFFVLSIGLMLLGFTMLCLGMLWHMITDRAPSNRYHRLAATMILGH